MSNGILVGALLSLALAIGGRQGYAQTTLTCGQAEEIHGYALQVIFASSNPSLKPRKSVEKA